MDRLFEIIPHIAREHEKEMKVPHNKRNRQGLELSFFSLLYADDTLLSKEDEGQMTALLHAVERVSEIFGLNLNKDKCRQLSYKGRAKQIYFRNGQKVPQEETVEYLGTLLHFRANPRPEILKRIAGSAFVRRKLDTFWKKAAMGKRNKLLLHEGIVSAKLLYALEAIPIPRNYYARIDASYLKGIRQILGIKTTYGQQEAGQERTNTNATIIGLTNKALSTKKKKANFRLISERIIERATTLLGKTIRRNPEDPMREVIMAGETWNIPQKGHNRVGAPSTNWLIETAMQAWERHELFNPASLTEQMDNINKKNHNKIKAQKKTLDKARARTELRDLMIAGNPPINDDVVRLLKQSLSYKQRKNINENSPNWEIVRKPLNEHRTQDHTDIKKEADRATTINGNLINLTLSEPNILQTGKYFS